MPILGDLKAQFKEASARYAAANGLERDAGWFMLKMHEEIGELTQAWNRFRGRGAKGGMVGKRTGEGHGG